MYGVVPRIRLHKIILGVNLVAMKEKTNVARMKVTSVASCFQYFTLVTSCKICIKFNPYQDFHLLLGHLDLVCHQLYHHSSETNRGHFMAEQRCRISLRVLKRFHEWPQWTSEIFCQPEKRNFVSPSSHVMFCLS